MTGVGDARSQANPGVTYQTGFVHTTSINSGIGSVGGGAGGFYSNGGYIFTSPTIQATPGVITPFSPFPELVVPSAGPSKLTEVQLSQLMREHTFIEMENSEFCLFCYALDQFKTRLDHIFVISEE